MIRLHTPALIRAIESVFNHPAETPPQPVPNDATPPAPGARSIGRGSARAGHRGSRPTPRSILTRFLDDVADAISPPLGAQIVKRLDVPARGEAPGVEDDDE